MTRIGLWTLEEVTRLQGALRRHWKRILLGALAGWITAIVVGATMLAGLEVGGLITRETSNTLAIAAGLGGVGLGALAAYALKPAPRRVAARDGVQRA